MGKTDSNGVYALSYSAGVSGAEIGENRVTISTLTAGTEKVPMEYNTQSKLTADPWAPVGFGQTLTLVKWLNAIGPNRITPARIIAQGKKFRGPVPLGAPSVRCGKIKSMPAVCNDQTQYFEYLGQGRFNRVSSWVRPPQ